MRCGLKRNLVGDPFFSCGERIVLHRRGKNIAALVLVEDLALLEELEERLDAEDFRTAKEEWEREGRQPTPLDEGVKELGIKA